MELFLCVLAAHFLVGFFFLNLTTALFGCKAAEKFGRQSVFTQLSIDMVAAR